jgi:hypothetical protein
MLRAMARENASWNVLPHGPIEKLAENLWWVSGSLPGMTLKRCMTVVRLADSRLVIHSAIALDEPSMRELEAWGRPAYLLVPSAYHRLDAPAYKARYPDLTVLTPASARAKVEALVRVDGTYTDFPEDPALRLEHLAALDQKEGAMLVRSSDGLTVVLNDAVMNMDRKRDVLGFLFTTVMGSAPGPRVSRLAKLMLVKDRARMRAELERYAAEPQLVRLIVAHEKVAAGADARAALNTACATL